MLATDENDRVMRLHRGWVAAGFPVRATAMGEALAAGAPMAGRAIACVDPRSRRQRWLIGTPIDGRRTPAASSGYAEAAAALRSSG